MRLSLTMLRPWLSRVALSAALLFLCPGGAQAGRPGGQPDGHRYATLDGEPIPLAEVSLYHCHDFAYPRYSCFTTQAARDRDMAVGNTGATSRKGHVRLGSRTAILGAQAVAYALIYEHSDFGGASSVISNPMPDLGVIGWNNTISSFKSTNGGRPRWWDGTWYSGSSWRWGTSAWVTYVGDYANDRFSSVLDP